jgi:hypothetical protein
MQLVLILFLAILLCYRVSAQNTIPEKWYIANPDAVELSGNERVENLSTSLGTVNLRWPRASETLFGRTPARAVTEAVNAVARTVKGGGWPTKVQTLNIDWSVIFMQEKDVASQMPPYLLNDCHPGWFTPPGNIYIVAERVAAGCGRQRSSTSVADGVLASVMVHEMGHALEYYILGPAFGGDRMRAEGFASWFERYAGRNTSMYNAREIANRHQEAAKVSLQESPNVWTFRGSALDYARASYAIEAVVRVRGISGLMEVYKRIRERRVELATAVKDEMSWSSIKYNEEIARAINSR